MHAAILPDGAIVATAATLAFYAAAVAVLAVAGRRRHARALAGFVPDCIVLVRRLLADPRVPRRRKWALLALIAYLAVPVDLVPDFIPVAGQADDAVLVALALRMVLRSVEPDALRELWPGPPEGLAVLARVAR